MSEEAEERYVAFSPYAPVYRSASCLEQDTLLYPVPLSDSKRVCMLFWSSSASSCSFSHMAACASASSESVFRAASGSGYEFCHVKCGLLLLVHLSVSPFCLSSASCDYIAYHFSTVLPPVFCRLTL